MNDTKSVAMICAPEHADICKKWGQKGIDMLLSEREK